MTQVAVLGLRMGIASPLRFASGTRLKNRFIYFSSTNEACPSAGAAASRSRAWVPNEGPLTPRNPGNMATSNFTF